MSSRNKGQIIEVALRTPSRRPGSLALLQAFLVHRGLKLTDLTETKEGQDWRITTFFPSKVEAQYFKNKLTGLPLKISVRLRTLYKTQWRDKWKKDFHPFALTEKIDIVP